MIGYATIGALDERKSLQFYDAVFGEIDCERKFSEGGWTGFGKKNNERSEVFVICKTANGEPARAGNGIMLGFQTTTKEKVEAAYLAGLANGGTDEGKPGPRPADSVNFYGAYLRDPTGNKICVYFNPSLENKK